MKVFGSSVIMTASMLFLLFAGCTTTGQVAAPMTGGETGVDGVRTFVLTGENFKFVMGGIDNPDIVVNHGDRVRIEFVSAQGFHDWVVDEFGAATERVRDGNSTSVEFVADRAGTFEYYCSIGHHRAQGMRGSLIIQ